MIQLHLGAFHHVKAHTGKALDQFVHHQGDGVGAAYFGQGPGLGHINGFGLNGGFPLGGLNAGLRLVHALGQALTHLVNLRAYLGPLLGG